MTLPLPQLKFAPPAAPGLADCGCSGIEPETPQPLFNRIGLSAIRYRVGEYGQFRESLRNALSSSVHVPASFPPGAESPLSRLLSRDEDDFTIALIDAFAMAADVLTFYQERLANESFLRTATERLSLQEMGKLVGYRLRPGVAAETWLAFALETPPVAPASLSPEPGNFVTGVPATVRLDAGLRVQSIPGQDEVPQSFELGEAIADARPEWNAIRPWLAETHFPARDERELFLSGVATGLRPGDALLLVGDEYFGDNLSNAWDLRFVTGVEADAANGRTRVSWARGLGSHFPQSSPAAKAHAYALRKRTGVFGNNSPLWRTMDDGFRNRYRGEAADNGEWPAFVISPVAGAVDLDTVQPEIAVDDPGTPARRSLVVLAKGGFNRPDENYPSGTYVELYQVTGTSEVSRAAFGISGKASRLELAGDNLAEFAGNVRETSVFGKSELLPLAQRPVTTPVSGNRVPVAMAPDGLEPGRRLIVRGNRVSDNQPVVVQATLVVAHPAGSGFAELEIAPALPAELVRASVVVYANVGPASHGESVSQILGSGSAGEPFQRFELKQAPLTYRAADNETGAAAELVVRVGGIAWSERSTLFGAAADEAAYVLATDEKGSVFVSFGDGIAGARLPSGVNNIRASYRKGVGAAGNLDAERLTQLFTRPLGLKSVTNPLPALGGTDPEPAEAARGTIPQTTRTLGRVVSLLDYEDFARAFSGIGKASAQVLQTRGGRVVGLTIAAPGGAALNAASAVWQHLATALAGSGDPRVAVTLLAHEASTFHVGLRVKCDPALEASVVLAAVEAALRAQFSFEARALGQPVHQSEIVAVAQAVPGVIAVDLNRLYGGTQPQAQTLPSLQVRLLASRMHVENGVALPAELLTLHPGPFDQLEEMP
ncbi:MAG TPA: putative baseplate assembly protein [Devosia sp.]|uniref:putative baseplate assembly protein n=1 Tax=Devosia sp. TaxID=1871048 RepID=UPI002DDCACB1|nr:putative baseplate assembly protein [Devosia sp.]HEV2517988.1 putative baseplate assembly protein [Devosia sp.]